MSSHLRQHHSVLRPRPLTSSVRLALLCLPLASQLAAPLAQARQDQPIQQSQPAHHYAIAAGPLGQALQQFAAQAGIMLSADGRLTDGKTTTGLSSDLAVAPGLQQLLAGTGLQAVPQDGGYVLQALPPATNRNTASQVAQQMAAVTIVGERSTEADGTYRPRQSRSALHGDVSPLDTPQVVNVVPAQVLLDQRPRNLDDALVNVSGITQGNTLASTQDTIMKRGFGGNRDGSIMHNGMPLVQGRGMNAAADTVEVLKGPSSLLYGIMDPGGVVNVVSKKPQLEQHTSLSALASSYGDGKNGSGETLDTTGPVSDGGLAYRVIADHVNEDYWRNYGRHRETLFAPSLAWYGGDTDVLLSYEHRQFLYPFDRGTALDPRTNAPLAIPATERLDEPFNVMDGRSDLGQLTIDHRIDAVWKVHAGFSYNREIYDANQLRFFGVNTTTGTLSRSNDATHGALSTDSYANTYLQGGLDLAGMRHDVEIGVDSEYRKIYRADLLRQNPVTVFSYVNPVYGTEAPSATVSAADSDQTDKLHDTALFMQDNIHLNAQWILALGGRYQSYHQVAGKGRPFITNTDTSNDNWLPRAGLVYKIDPVWSLYADYTESLKPTSTIAPLSTGVMITSSVLPEQARSWEAGAKYDNASTLSASVALYNINKKNVLVSQYNDVTKQTDWRTSGAARSRGLEADVAGRLSRSWNVIGSYAYTDAKTTEDPVYQGLRLWNVARQTASLYLADDLGNLGGGKLRLGAGAHYVGERPGDSANSFVLPAYTVADAFATYDTRIAGQNVKFQLNVKNMFDRTYYTSSVNRYFVSMGDSRQVTLLATWEF